MTASFPLEGETTRSLSRAHFYAVSFTLTLRHCGTTRFDYNVSSRQSLSLKKSNHCLKPRWATQGSPGPPAEGSQFSVTRPQQKLNECTEVGGIKRGKYYVKCRPTESTQSICSVVKTNNLTRQTTKQAPIKLHSVIQREALPHTFQAHGQ